MLDQLRSGLVSVDAAYSASGSFAAGCAIASYALSDYLLPAFPLRCHVEVQAAMTSVVAEASVSVEPN